MQNRSRTGFNFEPPCSATMAHRFWFWVKQQIYLYILDWHGQQEPKDAEPGSGGCLASRVGSRLVSVLVLPEPNLNQSLNRPRTGHFDPPNATQLGSFAISTSNSTLRTQSSWFLNLMHSLTIVLVGMVSLQCLRERSSFSSSALWTFF